MIISLGDAVLDLVANPVTGLPAWGEDREVAAITPHRGGAALNVAVNLGALGNRAALVAGVGKDMWGTFLRDGLAESEIDTRGVRSLSVPTAVTLVLTGVHDRAFVSVYGATAAFAAADMTPEVFTEATHVHISGYWQSRALAPKLPDLCLDWKARGITVSLDVGYDAAREWDAGVRDLLPLVDVFFPNEDEACAIARESDWRKALARLAQVVPWVVLKRGSSGATAQWGIFETSRAAFPATVVDTTGAGDAFNSGFLHAWLRGWSPKLALEFGCAMGALCVGREGGSTAPPTLDEVLAVLG